MNVGGDYYLIEFFKDDVFITEQVLLVHWNNTERAAEEYAKERNFKYTSTKTHYIREQFGDEI